MDNVDSDARHVSFATYADYIESTHSDNYRHYAWLVDFLRNGPRNTSAELLNIPAKLYILDSTSSAITSRKFVVSKNKPIEPRLSDALKEDPAGRQTRLVLVQYRQFESLHPHLVDAIGLSCGVEPDFFAVHFENNFDQAGHMLPYFPTHSLPSERRFLQIRTDDWSFMTTTWNLSEAERTFVVLELDHYLHSADQIGALHDKLVNHTTPKEIALLDQSPADYLFPYIRGAARQAASVCAQLMPFRRIQETSHDWQLDTKWETNQRNRHAIVSSHRSLARFLSNPDIKTKPTTLRLGSLLKDYEELIEESDTISTNIQMLLQQQAHSANIQQTRENVEQSDSVRRLSIVAFVFIPLSFSTSFFGMNINQLDTGSVSIGYFFLLAVLSTILCTIVVTTIKPIERAWDSVRRELVWKQGHANNMDINGTVATLHVLWGFVRKLWRARELANPMKSRRPQLEFESQAEARKPRAVFGT